MASDLDRMEIASLDEVDDTWPADLQQVCSLVKGEEGDFLGGYKSWASLEVGYLGHDGLLSPSLAIPACLAESDLKGTGRQLGLRPVSM